MNNYLFGVLLMWLSVLNAIAQPSSPIKRYIVPVAQQGVAVDEMHFYVINNHSIHKYTKSNGTSTANWEDSTGFIKHLNSGIIINDTLYCTNSNYPESPMASSLEMFDPQTLRHINTHSFGIQIGSATWVDRYKGAWYVAFAHYTGRGATEGKDNRWTQLVKFDTAWRQLEAWIFPADLVAEFDTRSNSGGFIDADGTIYCTGHDLPKLYQLHFPSLGYTLEWKNTLNIASKGQGIALDNDGITKQVYGILRDENVIVVSKIPDTP
ncbi:MAG: hypothetical protein RIG62_23540 [Cyclobacteriaceae bacterium]